MISNVTAVNQDLQKSQDLKAAREMESYFVHFLLKEMRKTLPKESLTGGEGMAQGIYYDMFDQQIADEIAKNGSFGLSNFIMKNVFPKEKAISQYENI